jgi:cell fate regulator YaaT (PSP1 superfamily)
MGCASCGTKSAGGPQGCGDNGHCATGGCNRLNTYDWLDMQQIPDPSSIEVVEVSYKQGARKEFCHCPDYLQTVTGDIVVVDEGNGYNIGRITLSGELVRLQMRKKRQSVERVLNTVVRRASDRDIDRLREARETEKGAMVRARAIARTLGVDLKIGDVEFRGDLRKATFFYTADGRVDFRELVRNYAGEFRVKIEMRQIGARQESARIGGLGSCGRELCCSTWLTDFKSVTTSAARYQNLSINQTKLSGQCGRLKCCLNYELDTYLDALQDFPKNVERLKTRDGTAVQIKTDIFKRLIYYVYEAQRGRGTIIAVDVDRVKEVKKMNKRGEFPETLMPEVEIIDENAEVEFGFDDLTGVIELPDEPKRRKSRRRGGRNQGRRRPGGGRKPGGKSEGRSTGGQSGRKDGGSGGQSRNKGASDDGQSRRESKSRDDRPNRDGKPKQARHGSGRKQGNRKKHHGANTNKSDSRDKVETRNNKSD